MKKKIMEQWSIVCYSICLICGMNKGLFVGVILFSIIGGIFPILSLLVTQNILNTIQLLQGPLSYLIKLLILYGALSVLGSLIQHFSSYFSMKFSTILTYDINYLLMEKCGDLSLEQLENTKTYDMITRLEGEIAIKPFIALDSILRIIYAMITYLISMAILLLWKPLIFGLFLVVSILFFVYYIKIGHREFMMRYERSQNEREAWYYTHLLTHDTAFKEVKILNLNRFFLNKYRKIISNFVQQEMKINKSKVVFSSFIDLLQIILSFGVMLISITEAFNGLILIGTAMTYINVASYVESNTSAMASSVYSLYNSNQYMLLLREFLGLATDKNEKSMEIQQIKKINVDRVHFSYPLQQEVLKDVSFQLESGSCVAIVGKNGSGKSTLLKLLCGLYDVTEGCISINDIDIKDIDSTSYRSQISVLFQDFLKYEGTLEENIRIGDIESENKKEEDIENALLKADVDFMKKNGSYIYSKFLGNWFAEGTQISGGQWQKIALARSYYKKASLYLLDEPSSALDVEAEMKVFNSFFDFCKENIGIYITHRFKIAQKADKIIMLDHGEIHGIGTHEELYRDCTLYRELYTKELEIN